MANRKNGFWVYLNVLGWLLMASCSEGQRGKWLTAADSTTILQMVLDYPNTQFDTVVAISRLHTDTLMLYKNAITKQESKLYYKGKAISYINNDPKMAEVSVFKPKIKIDFWKFKVKDTVQVQFGIRDWGLICDYRLVKDGTQWRVVKLEHWEGKW